MLSLSAPLSTARQALPRYAERIMPVPGPAAAARMCERFTRKGLNVTLGYFGSEGASPEEILAANLALAGLLADCRIDVYLSVKAPELKFDFARLRTIADAAASAGLPLLFDAHAVGDADRTLELASALLEDYPETGIVLPARWRRSTADALRFRDTSARLRIVKGEWADPEWGGEDIAENYMRLIARLAGRSAPVAVATHDPALAERALSLLSKAGTPCELEQLRGLPRRRTTMAAKRLGVPVRLYVPFGPGWWPYAVDKALDRPYLLSWMVKDRLPERSFFSL
jgi:proline dehydrogenase